MPGIRNNCELIHAYLGGFAGLFSAFLLMMGATAPAGTSDSVTLSLLTAGFTLLFVTTLFSVFYRQSFWSLLFSLALSSVILGFLLYYVALLFTTDLGQPFILFLIGVFLGIFLGRVVCRLCEGDPTVKNTPLIAVNPLDR